MEGLIHGGAYFQNFTVTVSKAFEKSNLVQFPFHF